MKKSITYYLLVFVIKIKGIKKILSGDPVDYRKLRKDDVFNPRNSYLRKNTHSRTFTVLETTISEISSKEKSSKLLIFIHGGAFVSGPVQHHWDAVEKIVKQTAYTVWMCNYPKAPEHTISQLSENIDHVYGKALEKFNPEDITIVGDSVGGTLAIALVQRLIQKNMILPHRLIVISPVVDATLSNPKIEEIEPLDIMLSKKGVLSAKEMCAGESSLNDASISPINGSFEGFPKTLLFIAENDITYPDQQRLVKKLEKSNIDHQVILGYEMPHIWPLLPVMKEAKSSFNIIIDLLKQH
ncbi:alpha/beta hydrolase [Sphingobacterium hungaricum]|uniref:Esterase n=1 Tax=Sphingobacterium hungaricum TaxID=2082723 RepID=A0A928UUP9_9SPHI|nr:alpha/beta hydrolase [Sphingobacterium hungaricum]MBE8712203.1 esterase [Sphingobacterium hungaricum]